MIDAVEGVTEQDAKIAGIAHDRGKGIVIAVNKWDAIEKDDKTIYRFTERVRNTLSFMLYAEIVFISAVTGQRQHDRLAASSEQICHFGIRINQSLPHIDKENDNICRVNGNKSSGQDLLDAILL